MHRLKRFIPRNSKQPFKSFYLRVDLQHYPEAQFIGGASILVPKEHAKTVYLTRVVEEKYWYWDEKGAAAYITMCQEEGYDVLRKTRDLLGKQLPNILDKVFEFFGNIRHTQNLPPLELVVLGVGSAVKENLLLSSIIDKYGHPNVRKFGPIHYVPVDISFPLLQNNLRSIFANKDLKECILHGKLVIDPVLTDFLTGLTGFLVKDACKLIVAQGIVWNAPIPDIFDAFKHLMTSDSLLLIDVEFVGQRTNEQIISNYEGQAAKAFFYHPLELLHIASQEKDEFFETNGQVVRYRDAFSDFSDKKGDIKAAIVQRSSLDNFIEQYDLPDEAESKIRLSSDEKSKTVVILYVPKVQKGRSGTIVLGYSTRFEYNEFKNFLKRKGFNIKGEWLDNPSEPQKATFGHYLLSLGPTPTTEPDQKILLLQDEIAQEIEDQIETSRDVLSERQKLAVTRFSEFEHIDDSKKIYEQCNKELDQKKEEFLKRAKSLASEKELKELESKMKKEINKILHGGK